MTCTCSRFGFLAGMVMNGLALFFSAKAGEPIAIEIDAAHVLQTVPKNFHGTNFVALWNSTGDSPGTVAAFRQLGARLVRFPGGVPAQFYDWQRPLETGWTELTPERAYALAKTSQAEMIFQTNTANDKGGTNKKNGQPYQFDSSGKHAAAWVQEARQKGLKVAFWEIGNEPEVDAAPEVKKSQDAVFQWYNAKFDEQARAIRVVDRAAKIMGPASTNTYFWWAQKNLEKFLLAHGNKKGSGLVDAISLHWYPDAGAGAWEAKRGAAQSWPVAMDYIRKTISTYDSRPLPVYLTEWNWGAGDKNDGGQQYSNALGCADCLGVFLRTGVSGQTHFCLQHVKRGWGVLGTKGDGVPENGASPTYFALSMAARLGERVVEVKNSADEKNVLSAYATTSADASEATVMVINKTGESQTVNLALHGLRPVTAKVWTLVPAHGAVTDREVIYNGKASPQPATEALPEPAPVAATDQFAQTIAPYGLSVITLSARPFPAAGR